MIRALLLPLVAFAVSGCADDGRDYGECVHSTIVPQFVPMTIGKSTMLVQTMRSVCTEHEYPAGDGPKYQAKHAQGVKP